MAQPLSVGVVMVVLLALTMGAGAGTSATTATTHPRATPAPRWPQPSSVHRHTRRRPPRPPPKYSSFECVGGGSQVVDFDTTESYFYGSGIDATDRRTRICKLRNVCVVGGRVTYFMDPRVEGAAPAGMRMTAFPDGGPVCVGLLPQAPCVSEHVVPVDVVPSPRPANIPFAEADRVHMLDVLGDASNWAHIVLDTMLPAVSAAHVFGDDVGAVQIVTLNNCSTYAQHPALAHKLAASSDADMRRACEHNIATWTPTFFDHAVLVGGGGDTCFRQLVMGHSHIFGLGYWYPHRAAAMRVARQRAYRVHGVARRDGTLPVVRQHHVMVWRKQSHWTPRLRPDLDMCDTVRTWLANFTVWEESEPMAKPGSARRPTHESRPAHGRPPHRRAAAVRLSCVSPASLSVRAQIEAASSATVIVSEEGSTTYLAMFARPGAAMVVVGSREMYILLGMADVQVWFADPTAVLPPSTSHAGSVQAAGPATLQLAMDRAGQRLGVEQVLLS